MLRITGLLLCAAALAYSQSQSSSADLKGSIVDPSGASVAGAQISVRDPQTGLTRATTSDDKGEFLFRVLPPSQYNLRVEGAGFAVKNVDGIQLRVGDSVALTIAMTLTQVDTQLEVTTERPAIETNRYQQLS